MTIVYPHPQSRVKAQTRSPAEATQGAIRTVELSVLIPDWRDRSGDADHDSGFDAALLVGE